MKPFPAQIYIMAGPLDRSARGGDEWRYAAFRGDKDPTVAHIEIGVGKLHVGVEITARHWTALTMIRPDLAEIRVGADVYHASFTYGSTSLAEFIAWWHTRRTERARDMILAACRGEPCGA